MKKSCPALVAVVLFASLFTPARTDAACYTFLREFGAAGTNPNQFVEMDGIAVDRFGHVFISDTYVLFIQNAVTTMQQCVKRWSDGGSFELWWPPHNAGGINWPAEGIDCNCDGEPFYVSPQYMIFPYGANVEHTENDGALLEEFPVASPGTPYYFRDVAMSANGAFYGIFHLISGTNDIPALMSALYVPAVTNWVPVSLVPLGSTNGMSNTPWGIDVDAWRQRVYITYLADSGPASIRVLDHASLVTLTNIMPWSYPARPLGIAVDDRNGNVLVCEAVSNMVYQFDTNGVLLCAFGGPGGAPAQFNNPTDLDVDMDGRLYVADSGNHRVQVFDAPSEGNVNFIIYKSKAKINWKKKALGKAGDLINGKGYAAIDIHTNITSLAGMPFSLDYGGVEVIPAGTLPVKANKKGTKALYKPDKTRKCKLIYKPNAAIVRIALSLKKGDIDDGLGVVDMTPIPPWLWARAQMTLSNEFIGVHYLRMDQANKPGKVYKAIKK
ncbi:hypothetical protein GX586_03505 [bacterium]|nr:hypothetical protein [bacterium]